MEQPLVSVVTPTFNGAAFLEKCLASVRSQTYPRIEHIVFDACSRDGSADILRRHAGRPGFEFHIEPDGGQADALNKGFARAGGEILCWLNSDDFYFGDDVIAKVVEIFEKHPEVDMVSGGGFYVDEAGRLTEPIIPERRRACLRHMRFADFLLQPATFWRRRVHRELDASLHYAFDWVFFLGMLESGAALYPVDDFYALYTMCGNNKTALDNSARRREIATILGRTFGRRSIQHLWARLIWGLYRLSEAAGAPVLKKGVFSLNLAVGRATQYRVYSC